MNPAVRSARTASRNATLKILVPGQVGDLKAMRRKHRVGDPVDVRAKPLQHLLKDLTFRDRRHGTSLRHAVAQIGTIAGPDCVNR